MKKILLVLAMALTLSPAMRADEGMWLLPLIEKINSDALRNLGSRLEPDQIYSINHSSIKDAVVMFGGGCTAEFISDNGLLVTNHHCGYGSIQSLSTTEHNYLEDGYWAMSQDREIPVPGLSVKLLQSMTDVTGKVKDEKSRKSIIEEAKAANPNAKVEVVSFYNDNVFYLVISKVYNDVRFVGTPPASMGKFGGDTDNWMWPRHTCDFSMFRVYSNAANEPASFSADNVPFTPRRSLSISLKGVKEGDFAMIMGYPARTQRFQTAAQLEDMLAINDIRIAARGVRQDVLWREMRADGKVALQYASKYAGSSNGWKKWIGEKEAFGKLDVIQHELDKEAALGEWISKRNKRTSLYGSAIGDISAAVARRAEAYRAYTLLNETLGRIELLSLSRARSEGAYADYNADVDRKVALALTKHYLANVAPQDKVDIDSAGIEQMFAESSFVKPDRRPVDKPDGGIDPAVTLMTAINDKAKGFYTIIMSANEEMEAPSKAYTAALLEWNKGKASYPDANSTCRLTYGTVKGYEPKDGVVYKYYTTLKGVMEKEDSTNYEFRVPERLNEIYGTKDYGQYANADGQLVTCFLTNLDITGGNSGSPVMDADGNLIGLAFDGNWEAMSGDVLFDSDLQRCICVDIRYVLLMLDKFGGASYLLDEMNIIR